MLNFLLVFDFICFKKRGETHYLTKQPEAVQAKEKLLRHNIPFTEKLCKQNIVTMDKII